MWRRIYAQAGGDGRRGPGGRGQAAGATALFLILAGSSCLTFLAAGAATSGWQVAIPIETNTAGDAATPQVATDGNGNAVAVWPQSDGTRDNIWANRYAAWSGWGTATLIETDNAGYAARPQVAVDGGGNAVAVWDQSDATRSNIWANRYTAGSGWGTAALIETNNAGNAYGPQVAVEAGGNAVAVWYQSDATRNNTWANWYTAGSGWGTATLIEADAGNALYPQVAVDGGGNALAVWQQTDATRYNIWANRYVAGSGWGTATLIETDNSGNASSPQVAVDGNGNAIGAWYEFDGTRNNIWTNRYAAGSGWGTATLLETDDAGNAYSPQVAFDGSGNAVAVWFQSDGAHYNIWANRYAAGPGWGTATLIETDNAGNAYAPQVALDGRGNALAVWYQADATRINIWANRYAAGLGWGTATLIETDAGYAQDPQVAVDGNGNAVAVWYQTDGTRYNIWANRFVAVDATPPSIVLATPSEGAVTNRSSVWVEGTAEIGARVSISGVAATVGANGTFGLLVALQPGVNRLVATAWDAWDNVANATVNVTFEDPVPVLEGQITAAQADASAMQANLTAAQAALEAAQARADALEALANATQTQLVAAQVDLGAAQSRVSALEAEANATQSQIDAAHANLTTAQSRVSALEADANSTQSQLDAAHANLTAAQARVSALEASAASTQAALAASQAREAALEANATAAKAELASAQSRITALETNGSAVQTGTDTGQAGLAMLLAAVGIAVGAVGCALALRSKKPVAIEETVNSPASAPKSPPLP